MRTVQKSSCQAQIPATYRLGNPKRHRFLVGANLGVFPSDHLLQALFAVIDDAIGSQPPQQFRLGVAATRRHHCVASRLRQLHLQSQRCTTSRVNSSKHSRELGFYSCIPLALQGLQVLFSDRLPGKDSLQYCHNIASFNRV